MEHESVKSKFAPDKFNPDKKDLLATSIKFNGNLTQIAAHYEVSRETVYQYTKRDPDGKEIIEFTRGYNTETELDLSEHVIRYALLNYKNNLGFALRAAEKVIDKKGYLRGWRTEEAHNKSGNVKVYVNGKLGCGINVSAPTISDSDNQGS